MAAKFQTVHSKMAQEEVFVFPASFAQQRLWFLNQLAPENPFYNVSAGIRLCGKVNLTALEQTFNEIARRHESLRTTFALVEGQLMQIIVPHVNLPLTTIDLQAIPANERERIAKQLAIQEAQRPFNLTTGPLLHLKVLTLQETEAILLLMLHHIVADGWSLGVLLRELGTLYAAFSLGQPSPLPELPIQYADFAQWQRQWLQGNVLESQLAYWRQQLKQMPVLELPSDRPRPPVPTYRGATQPFALSQPLTQAIEVLSQQEQASLFMTLLAAFQTLLYRYTGQTDIAVGSLIANRPRRELEGLIGFFVNSLVLRTDLSGNPTFRELLSRVRDVAFGAYAHQDLPFEQLVQELTPQRDLSRHPLFQVAIALQNTPIDALALAGLQLEQFEFDSGTARLDLELQLWQSPAGLQGQITYSTDLFEQTTIARMLGHFQTLLQGIVCNPEQRIAELTLLTAAEQQLLIEWNDIRQGVGDRQCFHRRFEAQAQLTPDAIAVVCEDEQLTYQGLSARSNQLAHYLQTLGAGPEVLVGICVERSCEMIVAVLAILKAGSAYVPFDPTYPPARLEFMLEDTQVPIIVTQEQWQATFAERSLPVCLDRDAAAIAQQPQHNVTSTVTSTNLAYAIYTSGSTGKPKGVLIEQRGLTNLAHAQRQVFDLQSSDRILQFASLSFDASIFEIVMALQVGATLYLAKQESRLGTALVKFLQKNAITTVTLPPTVLRGLPVADLPALKTIISAGEACSSEVVAGWAGFGRRFFNAYGPTEATVWSTVAEIGHSGIKPPLGRAIANTQLHVLDADLQPVAVGIPGELYIGGDSLARGYLNRPELTAERFIPNPFGETSALMSANRLYKTGDLVRYHSDGSLEFLGRIDDQVKIRGYRIELGEIETVLSQHPAIQETAVAVHEDRGVNQRLVAYIVFKVEKLTPTELRHYLQEKLPEYLIPSAFVVLELLPLTPNGKIDRNTLRCLHPPAEQRDTLVTPRTPTEEKLAKLWAQVLGLEQVSVDDNFFTVGGDSLLAMQLIEQVQQQFQQEFPLSNLFLAPTIAQLATLLGQPLASTSSTASDWSPLVPLQPAGSNRPFFCVHPVFGVVFPYYELARQLGTDQPFYGLHPVGLTGKQPPYTQIKDMAAAYLQALRQVQPQGPYLLGGWSFGGLVAFEMAQQLQSVGQQVALLALIDTLAPVPQNAPSLYDGLKFFLTTAIKSAPPFLLDYVSLLTTLRQHQSDRRSNDFEQSNSVLPQISKFKFWHWLQWAAIVKLLPEVSKLRVLDELTVLPLLRVFYANSQAAARYTPKAYADKITLFRTAQPLGKVPQDTTLGWSQLTAAEVEIHQVPGNHLSMMKKPYVQVLAEQLRHCIDQVS
ncbi:non-ribosomal peptide synthetase [Chroococcidiopsis sp. CCMEE 29]|uniref:non-ribosomal peptide synthetase n=1 Tax=Chroococcidiopsis sp. CCMEE 29 TaxID=155894 RepID=UPI002022872B|nr:non-ribosomal peptide synthetase [Chroococcidiopsis sp. CCMEE 29]